MYHKSNLGKFAAQVEHYADQNGYVPESDEDFANLTYSDPGDCLRDDLAYRAAFLEDAQAATADANRQVEEWQRANA